MTPSEATEGQSHAAVVCNLCFQSLTAVIKHISITFMFMDIALILYSNNALPSTGGCVIFKAVLFCFVFCLFYYFLRK